MAYLGTEEQSGSRASMLGSAAGAGLSKGLSALAEQKLGQLQRQADVKFFEQQGYPKETAELFAYFRTNPAAQQKLISQYVPREDNGVQDQLLGQQNQFQPSQFVDIPQELQQQAPQQQDFMQQLDAMLKNPMTFAQGRMGIAPQLQQSMRQQVPQQTRQPQQMQQPIEQPMPQPQRPRPPQFKKPLTAAEQLNQTKYLEGIKKERNDLINSYESAAQTADSVVAKVKAIEKLSQRSDFKTGYDYYISKNYTGGLPRSNQLVDKLIAELTPALAAANNASGNRMTDAQRELAANSIPNPYEMTKEGMKDAANALTNIYKIPREYANTANQVSKSNPLASASDLQSLINEQAKPKIEKLYSSIVPEELNLAKETRGGAGLPGENFLKSGARGVTRAAESFAGTPGDIVDFVSGIVGKVSPEVGKVLSNIPFPSSSQLREAGKETIGKVAPSLYGEPSGTLESVGDKFGSLLGSILFPLGGPGKAVATLGVKPTLVKGLKLAGLGTLAGYAGKAVGGETGEKAATIGTVLLSNIGGPRAIRAYAETLPAKQGNEIFKAMKEPSRIHEFIKSAVPSGRIKSDITKTLFGLGAYGLLGLKGLGKAGAAGIGAGYAEKALRALNQSPELRAYFYKAISSAAKENPAVLLKTIGQIDNLVERQKLDQ